MPPVPVDDEEPDAGPPRVALVFQIDQSVIEVPTGTISESEELWSYLDEQRIPSRQSLVLGRNGVRVGVVPRKSWPDVERILTRMTGRAIVRATGVALPGAPYAFDLHPGRPGQTIFVSHPDRTASGADYPPGDNILAFNFTVDADDRSRMMVAAVPQIRTQQRKPRLVHQHGTYMWRYEPIVYSFASTGFRFELQQGDIVIIGPGSRARRPHSVGHHFLVHERKGIEVETLLIVIPRVIAKPI